MDTIFALSSGSGRAGVAVMRLSGPQSGAVLRALAGGLPAPRRASLRRLADADGIPIDDAVVLWLPGPGSFTGEDMAELHTHGSRAVIARLSAILSGTPGLRAAVPGEFTRRAVMNGRMDLTAAEALADLLAAETEMQRRQAVLQAGGALARRVGAWRSTLLGMMAAIEANLDFADEDDVDEASLVGRVKGQAADLAAEVVDILAQAGRGERLRDGFVVVIAGPPNAGKSTLLNALVRRDVAIVSDRAGTTRDAIEVHLDLSGLPVTLVDTAGLRDSEDPVEQEGIARARARAGSADLVLWLTEGGDGPPADLVGAWRVQTKLDSGASRSPAADLAVSARTGEGLPSLLDALEAAARRSLGTGDALVTRARQREALGRAAAALGRIADVAEPEFVAEELRAAAAAFAELLGEVGVEDVLDVLFGEFCIGK
jgi:tRNA modification GTPase